MKISYWRLCNFNNLLKFVTVSSLWAHQVLVKHVHGKSWVRPKTRLERKPWLLTLILKQSQQETYTDTTYHLRNGKTVFCQRHCVVCHNYLTTIQNGFFSMVTWMLTGLNQWTVSWMIIRFWHLPITKEFHWKLTWECFTKSETCDLPHLPLCQELVFCIFQMTQVINGKLTQTHGLTSCPQWNRFQMQSKRKMISDQCSKNTFQEHCFTSKRVVNYWYQLHQFQWLSHCARYWKSF